MSVSIANVPQIAPGVRLQWEPTQDAHVLLYPEGMVKLNGSAGEILAQCDGNTPVSVIVTRLEQRFGMQDLDRDVRAFLDLATEQRWVEWA